MKATFPVLTGALCFAVAALVSCDTPGDVVDPGLQLVWLAAPPDVVREGDTVRVAARVTNAAGQPVPEFEGATVTLRFAAPGDSQPATACGTACTVIVADGQAAVTVGWISAGTWTATACLDRPDGGEDLCAEHPFSVMPVQAVLVTFPVDSVGRRERFAVEARLRLPDGTAVTDLVPTVRVRFGPDDIGAAVRCPEDGPLCQRVPVGGVVRLDSVLVLDTAATVLEACVVAPNGHERCDPAGPRSFRVVVPRATLRFVTQPAAAVVGIPFNTQPVVEILEPDGTRRTGFSDSVFLRLEGDGARWALFGDVPQQGTVRDRVPTLASLGLATFSGARINRPGDYRLRAEAPGAVSGLSDNLTVTLDPSELQLILHQGDDQTAPPLTALPIEPTVRVSSPANDPVIGIPVRFSAESGGSVEAEWDTTDLDGLARPGRWTLGPAFGGQTLGAEAAGFPMLVFSATAEVIPFERLAFITPPAASVIAGDTLPSIVIELQDAQGRRVVGGTDSVRFSVSGFAMLGTLVREAVDGRVTFDDLFMTRSGRHRVLAWDPRFESFEADGKTIEDSVTVLPRTAEPILNVWSIGGTSAMVGEAVNPSPIVRVHDIYDNGIPGRTVTFTPEGPGLVQGGTQITDDGGFASPSAWILGPVAGAYVLRAFSDDLFPLIFMATAMEPTFNFTDITAGGDFTCGPAVNGNQPHCWGANTRSQLGEGTQTTRSRPTAQAGGLLPMTQMTAGWDFACGIAQANGAAYCWGFNLYGPLGIGAPDLNFHATPEAVNGGHVFTQLSAGFYHVCGLDTAGVVWCWGGGTAGQLGVGIDLTGQYEPLQVISTARFVQIDVGLLHSCALADNGDVWCWGSNDYGQTGANDVFSATQWIPVRVTGGRAFTEISAGGQTTCGISQGSVYCWGRNVEGQGGQGSTEATFLLEPVPALGILGTARHISVGTRHACATNGIDLMYCWGDNNRGQLGDGTATQRWSAVEVTGGVNRFVTIDAGHEHTCALRDGGGAYCWGYNASGRLGLGFISNINVTAPTQVVRP